MIELSDRRLDVNLFDNYNTECLISLKITLLSKFRVWDFIRLGKVFGLVSSSTANLTHQTCAHCKLYTPHLCSLDTYLSFISHSCSTYTFLPNIMDPNNGKPTNKYKMLYALCAKWWLFQLGSFVLYAAWNIAAARDAGFLLRSNSSSSTRIINLDQRLAHNYQAGKHMPAGCEQGSLKPKAECDQGASKPK